MDPGVADRVEEGGVTVVVESGGGKLARIAELGSQRGRDGWWPWVVLARRGSGEGDKHGTSYSRGSDERVLACIGDNWTIDRPSDLNC